MPDRRFIDTNVVLYLYSEDEPDKKAAAEAVLGTRSDAQPTQAIGP